MADAKRTALVTVAGRNIGRACVLELASMGYNVVINGSADRVAPPKDTATLVSKLREQKGITISHEEIEGADHFFKDDEAHMKPMIDTVQAYVKRRLTEGSR